MVPRHPTDPLPLVAILVVTWNRVEETLDCLASLRELEYPARRIYLVDNASTDGTAEMVRALHPDVTVIEAPQNLGYAAAFNLGCRAAIADGATYVWLLNNDTTLEPNALDVQLRFDQQHGPAIVSPKILFRDRPDTVWYAGGYLDADLKSHHMGRGEPDDGGFDAVRQVQWASGCSLFCSVGVLQQVGPMDERYFLYLEDVDWCLNAQQQGVPIYYLPTARIYHRVSASMDQLDGAHLRYYAWRNYYLLASQRGGFGHRIVAYSDLLSRFAKILLRQTFFPSYRRDPLYRARTRGLIDFVRGRFGPMPVAGDAEPSVQAELLRL